MARNKSGANPEPTGTLRQRAEALLRATPTETPTMPTEDVQALVHELSVHQIELEIQNEELRNAQVELSHTRDRYADLYEFAPVGYMVLDRDGTILEANLTVASLLGVDRHHLLKSHLSKFVVRESQDELFLHQQAVFASNEKQTIEIKMHEADGTPLTARLESIAFDVEDQRCYRTALLDITATHRVKEQLAASEQRYRRLTDAVIDYIFTVRVDKGGEMEATHGPNCEAIMGYTPDEFAANTQLWISIVPKEDRPLLEHHIRQTLAGENPAPLEYRICRKDGTVHWVLRVTSPHHDEQGRLTAYDVLLRDITLQKKSEATLRELNIDLDQSLADSEEELQKSIQQIKLFSEAIAHLGEGVVITTDHLDWPGPSIVFVNAAMCRITGYTADELIGQTPRILQSRGTDRKTLKRIKAELSTSHSTRAELTNIRKDGTPYQVELFVTALFNPEGRRTNFVSINRDITERKRNEETLRREHELSEGIINSAQSIILLLDFKGRIVRFNPYMEELTGWKLAEVKNRDWFDTFLPERDRAEIRSMFSQALQNTPTRGQMNPIVTKDGREIEIEWYDAPLTGEDGKLAGLLCTGQDITDRRRAEQQLLRVSEEERKRLGHDLHDSICQELRGLAYLADALAEKLDRAKLSYADQVQRFSDKIVQVMEGVRKLSHSLDPVMLVGPDGLIRALRHLALTSRDVFRINCQFRCLGEIRLRKPDAPINLYRIAQEAVHNALHHGQATRVTITLKQDEDHLILKILDNGSGLPSGESLNQGLGIHTMRYRIASLGGQMTIANRPGKGVEVACSLHDF